MRIDSHVHGKMSKLKVEPDVYVEECRALGIERIALIEDAESAFAAHETMPDFVIPVVRVDIDATSAAEVREHVDRGAAGIKFIDPQFSYGDTRYDPLYGAISEAGRTAVFHTGYLGRGFGARSRPTDITLMRPAAVDCLSRRHPDLKIIMAHYGNPWWEEAWKIAWSTPHVYADLSGGTAYRRSLSMWREMFAPNGELDEQAVEKLMFASDVTYFDRTPEVAPYFGFYDGLLRAIEASAELTEKVNRGNAKRLFHVQ